MFGPQATTQLSRVTELGLLERRGLSFVAARCSKRPPR